MSRIIQQNAVQTFQDDLIDYMIEVNRMRQLPDHRDGLKKVQKRIIDIMTRFLSCMNDDVKSASIVGRTMEISHPQMGAVHSDI